MNCPPFIERYRDLPAALVRAFSRLHNLTEEQAYMRLIQGRYDMPPELNAEPEPGYTDEVPF